VLVDIARNTKAPAAARVSAAQAILDRGYGKPTQAHDVEASVSGSVTVQYVTAPSGPAPEPDDEDYETDE